MFYRYFFFIILAGVTIVSACKKIEKNIIYIDGVSSQFAAKVIRPYSGNIEDDVVNNIDSAFYFINLSKRGDTISYHWDFGDGSNSTEIEPIHRYTSPGYYTVTMETKIHGIPSDTATLKLQAIKGQNEISLGENFHTRGVDIIPIDDGRFLLLGEAQTNETRNGTSRYFLMLLNDRHQQISHSLLPVGDTYTSLTASGDGFYLLTSGETDVNQINRITKVSSDGSIQWSKAYQHVQEIKEVKLTTDGGFLLTGSRNTKNVNGGNIALSYLIKTNNSGNLDWDHFFIEDNALYNSAQVYEDADGGFVVAGADIDYNNTDCWHCSSLSLIKLNKSGTVLWRHRAPWGTWRAGSRIWVHKLIDNRFLISSLNSNALYYLSAQMGFEDRKLLPFDATSTTVTQDGNIVATGGFFGGNGNTVTVVGIDTRGIQYWEAGLDAMMRSNGGYICCPQTYPRKVISLANGGTLLMALRNQYKTDRTGDFLQTALVEFDESGNIQ